MGKLFAPTPSNLPTNFQHPDFNLNIKISPTILLIIIIILAIILFLSGLLHLLIRCLYYQPTQSNPNESNSVTPLQGQLQQLFHLHDSGVDQSYIDMLPVFPYKAIIGVKDPFDCAVCLSEFEPNDKLRLLPICSHAFHMDCIDTWLLSHSTCPICRFCLITDSSIHGYSNPIPFVCVLESGSGESSREAHEPVLELDSEYVSNRIELGRKSAEKEKIVNVKLGKFMNVDEENNNEISNNNDNSNLGSRRCYSMGSFAYVMDQKTSLQVPVKTLIKKQSSKKAGHRVVMSEYGYGYDSNSEYNGIEGIHTHGNGNGRSKRESQSVSKIWQRNKNGNDSLSRRTISEIEIVDNELGLDEETQSCYSFDSLANPNPSTSHSHSHRRTLLWLMGRHSKVVHNHSSSMSSNV